MKVSFDENGNMIDENGNVVSKESLQKGFSTNDENTISYTASEASIDDNATNNVLEEESARFEARMKAIYHNVENSREEDAQAHVLAGKSKSTNENATPIPIITQTTKPCKYQVTPNTTFFIRFGLVQKEDGRFVPIREDAIEGIPEAESHWVKFRMWTYNEELDWKDKCTEYDSRSKMQMINTAKLNEIKLRWLMLDWSFGEYDSQLKLLHCDGKLSDESYNLFKGMYPSIANTIVDMMNLVLESNQ